MIFYFKFHNQAVFSFTKESQNLINRSQTIMCQKILSNSFMILDSESETEAQMSGESSIETSAINMPIFFDFNEDDVILFQESKGINEPKLSISVTTPKMKSPKVEAPNNETPKILSPTISIESPDESPEKQTRAIHQNIKERGKFMQNLIFENNNGDDKENSKKIIHTGFDVKGAQINLVELDNDKRAELNRKKNERISDLGVSGLVSQRAGNLALQVRLV